MSLPTPLTSVEKLQKALQVKAKSAVGCRFYTLWDKVWRWDVLAEAYRRCRANGGAPGVDGQSFAAIESEGGVGSWLAALREELRRKEYRPQPLLRVWIPKASGGQRPLGIPTIRDRVVQMAVLLVIGPIFEADLCDEQYGFRSGVDAKMAVRRAYYHVAERGLREVVDADLSDYFNTIPHGDLMRCVSRRIADGSVLSVVKAWLEAPAVERRGGREHRTTAAAETHRGTPQGGVISPLLANLYFRRFVLAWKQFGHERQLQARVVNYADDLVICCRPGNGPAAMAAFRSIITRLGLTVNERKTRLVQLPEESLLPRLHRRTLLRQGGPHLHRYTHREEVGDPTQEANPRGDEQSLELATARRTGRGAQSDPSRLVRVFQPGSGGAGVCCGPAVH